MFHCHNLEHEDGGHDARRARGVTGQRRLLLVGGGHSHVEVLRRFALLRAAPGARSRSSRPSTRRPTRACCPGVVAGHYREDEASLPLPPLARAARARFVRRSRGGARPRRARATLASGPYARLRRPVARRRLDAGREHAGRARARRRRQAGPRLPGRVGADPGRRPARATVRTIAVVGGGAGGVEILLAMHYRLHARSRCARAALRPRDRPAEPAAAARAGRAPAHPARAGRARRRRSPRQRGAWPSSERAVLLRDGRRGRRRRDRLGDVGGGVAVARRQRARDATSAASSASTRTCARSRIRSCSRPATARRCATRPHPKSGLYAVRHGPPLAANLIAPLRASRSSPYRPQRRGLALIATGGRDAIALLGSAGGPGRTGHGAGRTASTGASSRATRPPPPARRAGPGAARPGLE